jgi:hypothetical protein
MTAASKLFASQLSNSIVALKMVQDEGLIPCASTISTVTFNFINSLEK